MRQLDSSLQALGRLHLMSRLPTPEDGEVVVFRDFFTCGLIFPCDPILDFGCFFGEDSSALADVVSGDVQVYLDYEDLRV
jgi:hypothetical protein